MTPEPERIAYIGRAACGCIRAAIVDGEDKQRVAAFVADIVRRGLTVDRMACADVRAAAWSVCSRHKRRDASLAAARREPS